MTFASWIWLATACYALHMLEEYELDWRDWAREVIGLPVEWGDFYVTNAIVVVLGIVAANIATASPPLALTFPALMLINATFFHVLPVVVTKGRFSPGLFTAVILFYPVGIACYASAAAAGLLSPGAVIVSFGLGALLMAYPIILIRIRSRPYFRQDR
ncbi:MAG: HXXEE domain-containing protein [Methylovirgula sp.]